MKSYHTQTGDRQRDAIESAHRDATKPTRPQRPASADGQLARVAELLRERRTRGLSSREAIDLSILRLPNRVCELRKRGWVISSKREATECLRYFLVSEPSQSAASNYAERTHAIEREAMPLFSGDEVKSL